MKIFHVNPENGNVGVCSAQNNNCPFGGEEIHFTSKEAARLNYEQNQGSSFRENLKSNETKVDVQEILFTSRVVLILGERYTKEADDLPLGSVLIGVDKHSQNKTFFTKLEDGRWYSLYERQDGSVGVSHLPRNIRTVEGSERAHGDELFFSQRDPELRNRVDKAIHDFERSTELIASQLHETWRNARKRESSRWQPLIKTDQDGVKTDIANTDFGALPRIWRQENLDSARIAILIIEESDQYGGKFPIRPAEEIHNEWLRRASKPKKSQNVPYGGLSDYEKAKDIRVLATALKIIQENY